MTEQATMFDLAEPAYLAEPYATWDRMRGEAPAYEDSNGVWYLTRHADCVAALNDRRLSANRVDVMLSVVDPADRPRVAYLEKMNRAMMLLADPPDHTRLRRLVARAFTPRAAEALRPHIQSLTDELLAAAPADFDTMRDLALPLPYYVIADMLGVPREDRAMLKAWSTDVANAGVFTPERGFKADQSMRAFGDYLRPLVRRLRDSPDATLFSTLVSAEEDGDRMSEDELFAMAILLIIAGHETTTDLIGNGLWLLLKHPEQLQLLRADPSLLPGAIHEILRYHGSVQQTARRSAEEIEYGGKLIPEGKWVRIMLGAANRDPAVFAEPDRFDITRNPNPHLGFGDFIHKCIGAPLALVEGQVAIGTLLRRYPNMRLADTPAERKQMPAAGDVSFQRLPIDLG